MRFRIEQRIPGGLEAVEEALIDREYLERLATLPKLGAPELLEQTSNGDVVHQRVRYRFVGDLNAAVRRVVDPARLTWVEDSTVDRLTHRTIWRILPDHYESMIHCHGTFVLEPDGDRVTRRIAEGDIKVTVPLVGGRVERAIVSGLEEHAAAETDVLADWLANDP